MELGRRRGAEPVSPAVHCLGAEISGSVANVNVYAVVPGINFEDTGHRVGRELKGRVAGVLRAILRRDGGGGLRRTILQRAGGGGLRRGWWIVVGGRQEYFAAITGFQISQSGWGVFEGEVGAGRYPPIGVGPGGVLAEVEFRGKGGA